MLAGLAIFKTAIGDISLGYGSAMAMVLGLLSAVFLGALYLVVRRSPVTRPVTADQGAEVDDQVARGETGPRFKVRVNRASRARGGWDLPVDRRYADRAWIHRARTSGGESNGSVGP